MSIARSVNQTVHCSHSCALPALTLASLFVVSGCGASSAKYQAAPSAYPQSTVLTTASVESDSGGAEAFYPQVRTAAAQGGAPAPAPAAPGPANAQPTIADGREAPKLEEKLVIEGWVDLQVEDVAATAAAIRAQVEAAGGSVVTEQLSGGATSWRGDLQVKVPPKGASAFMDWLVRQGEVQNKRIQGTDVSRTLFDQEIALENLTLTLERLRKLLDREGLAMPDILAIEQQMTRLRGEIERIKGEKRYLEHRVALATITIQLSRREGAVLGARAKFYPGPKFSTLILLDPEGRERVRLGGGVAVHTLPQLTLELDVFAAPDGESTGVLATFGGSTYSDFLGRGKNRFLNPYLGMRVGYAYLGDSAFAFSAGGGVELFKHKYVLVDTDVQVYGLAGESFDVALVASGSLVIAF